LRAWPSDAAERFYRGLTFRGRLCAWRIDDRLEPRGAVMLADSENGKNLASNFCQKGPGLCLIDGIFGNWASNQNSFSEKPTSRDLALPRQGRRTSGLTSTLRINNLAARAFIGH
jgi:hypothetical protein